MGFLNKLLGNVTSTDIGKTFIHPDCKDGDTLIKLIAIDDKTHSDGPICYKVLTKPYWIKNLSVVNTFNTRNKRRPKELR